MYINMAPTKGNLMQIQNTLTLSQSGYQLMDRKRMILMNEIMAIVKQVQQLQVELDQTLTKAYQELAVANASQGILSVYEAASNIPLSDGLRVQVRSVMGSEVPNLKYRAQALKPAYSFGNTTIAMDRARLAFEEVKKLQIQLGQLENAAYRLANNIQKTKKRVNALQNVTIPQLENAQKTISSALEEKEREEFTRLKVVKRIINA
ncbi:ATPase [Aerococcus urinaehominis]|uniref:V-type ATP synthase subunit D n=1 Tax=Aerococcus urinaehominis TaxID=128944 RepID=A0A0X8FK98_9LACT|nr:V-type ATP synthase subunit D [Aerococcus urinaehominis]AMB98878.1 ATPase [Aerococcus urinaehominis]SDM16244.1 V/A-type H+-transporting ATPase subunit D [Aerococcus urinaehominis]